MNEYRSSRSPDAGPDELIAIKIMVMFITFGAFNGTAGLYPALGFDFCPTRRHFLQGCRSCRAKVPRCHGQRPHRQAIRVRIPAAGRSSRLGSRFINVIHGYDANRRSTLVQHSSCCAAVPQPYCLHSKQKNWLIVQIAVPYVCYYSASVYQSLSVLMDNNFGVRYHRQGHPKH